MDFQHISISPDEAEEIFFNHYGLRGKATKLAGEIDFNFKIVAAYESKYVLKISRPNADLRYLDFQEKMLTFLKDQDSGLHIPTLLKDKSGNYSSYHKDSAGRERQIRALNFIDGRLWSSVNPKSEDLRFSLGIFSGRLAYLLKDFNHDFAEREFPWDIAQSLWTKEFLPLFNQEERGILEYFHNEFEDNLVEFSTLRKSIIHNDANDNNIIVSPDLLNPKVEAIIDFGDAIFTQSINELAVTCAYAIMDLMTR